MSDEKWGLVLAGGGARGAYQIGVWKALHECGFDRFDAISGASVGGLNTVLWAMGDAAGAWQIWSEIQPQDFISFSDSMQDFLQEITEAAVNGNLTLRSAAESASHISSIASRDGLRSLIRRVLDEEAVSGSRIPLYVDVLSTESAEVEYHWLNCKTAAEIENLLIATSSIPVFYGSSEVGGREYMDGGTVAVGDNIPWKPLYDWEHIRNFVVVELGRVYAELPEDCRVIRIHPETPLGNPLDFTHGTIMRRMEQGYQEAKAVMEKTLPALRTERMIQYGNTAFTGK